MTKLYKDERLYESELVKNPNFILQSLRDMSAHDLNLINQIEEYDKVNQSSTESQDNLESISKIKGKNTVMMNHG